MVVQPCVVFRVEPAKPDFQQALQDIEYGNAMEEADMSVVQRALRNILDFFISALKETSRDGSAFMRCFKSTKSWPVVVVVIRRCEAIIRYCLGQEDTEYVRSSLGTVRFVKAGKPQEERETRCGMIAAQAGKTIWLYEAWWRATRLQNERGIRIEKGQRAPDALANAFMQAQEGTLFHEIVHLASVGQMRRLLHHLHPSEKLPRSLWQGRDMVGDSVFHDHVNTALHSEGIVEAKYTRYHKGGRVEWEAAYHLSGVRDLAILEKGDMASILNADSYNGFAALALLHRVEIHLATQEPCMGANPAIPHLHTETVSRLQKAYVKGAVAAADDLRNEDLVSAAPRASVYDYVDSIPAQRRNGRFAELDWPTLAESAAAMSPKSKAR